MRLHEGFGLVGIEPDSLLAFLVAVVALELTGHEGHHTLPSGFADLLDPLAIHGEGSIGNHDAVSVADYLTGLGIHDGPQTVPKVPVDLDRMADGEVWVDGLGFHARDYRV